VAVFARHVYVTGDPRRIDEAIDVVRKDARELLAEQPGFAGVVAFADRDLGKLLVGSMWESEAARAESDERLREQRATMLAPFASSIAVDSYEVAAVHQVRRPEPGAGMRRLLMEADPAQVDRLVDTFKETAIPMLDSIPGFCRAMLFVDRARGRATVGLIYADRDALAASRSAAAGVRAQVTQAAGTQTGVRSLEEFELVLFDLPG
jgi:quinol monooxygenase YgiN